MAHVTWLQADESYRSIFGGFVSCLESAGHVVAPIVPVDAPDAWLHADAYIVSHTGYILEDPIQKALERQLESGRRVLFLLHEMKANPLLEPRFGIAVTADRHFDTTRWRDPQWRSQRDRIVARPADAISRIDTLLSGVNEVLCEQPWVVRCFDDARPLLSVKARDLVNRRDLATKATDQDRFIAATWGSVRSAPQIVVIGTGTALIDEFLEVADNRRFAQNIVRWLGGERSELEIATESQNLVDEIDLTLTPLIVRRLAQVHGVERWDMGIPESIREKIASYRPDSPIELALDLSDKVRVIFKDQVLIDQVGRVGQTSKTNSRSVWGRVIGVRNKVAHKDRLVEPITEEECATLRAVAAQVRAAHEAMLNDFDDDPRGL